MMNNKKHVREHKNLKAWFRCKLQAHRQRKLEHLQEKVRRNPAAATEQQSGADDKILVSSRVACSQAVLDDMRKNAGKFPAETGGLLASMYNPRLVDCCCFDEHCAATGTTFEYDVESMSRVYQQWCSNGWITHGIYHSHPRGCIRPSYHDVSTALLHLDFFELDYFYMPILQPAPNGCFTMYFYIVDRLENHLRVSLDHVVQAEAKGYHYIPFAAWHRNYKISELNAYRKEWDAHNPGADAPAKPAESEEPAAAEYFAKIEGLYPDAVKDKVVVCVGTGGARSFLENCARQSIHNFVLIDADQVSPSNVATQAVYISEMGKKKVDVIRDCILDINPAANVVCVDKFLDDNMSDEEFKGYLDRFPARKSTDYLILGCTDDFAPQRRSAVLALKYGIPYLAAMMYFGGAAAELMFVYPGVTASCPRCILRSRFEQYEDGFKNDVTSAGCGIFKTERMNALKGELAMMMLSYHEDPDNKYNTMLDFIKDRNFAWIRLSPDLKETLGIELFDDVLAGASRFTFMDETLWIPQKPDSPENGAETCKMCGGTGDLTQLRTRWADVDTRTIRRGKDGLPADLPRVTVE